MKIKSELIIDIKEHYSKGHLSGVLFTALTLVALAVALQQFYIINLNTATRYSLWWHIPFNLLYFWFWFLIFPLLYWITAKFRVGGSRFIYWSCIYLIFPVLIVLFHQLLATLVINMSLGYLDVPTLLYKRVLRNPWLELDIIIYFAVMIAINVFEYSRKYRNDTLKLTQLQAQLVGSQLSALESQLHPHFLFNTLNTVSTLVLKKENSEAERMLSLLHDFLKATIYGSERHVISLDEELKFINQYLEIEKVRFADKLDVVEDIDAGTLNAGVPNLLLQPIIENAIRYAIAPKKTRGVITIKTLRENRKLKILVEDNGPGINGARQEPGKHGVGLKVTRERLNRLFGEDHIFELTSPPGGGATVNIEIPFVEYVSGEKAASNVV